MVTPDAAVARRPLGPAFITLFLLATGMTTLAVAGTAPILPLLQTHFSGLARAASLSRATVSVGAIGIVVGAPLTAHLVRRTGRRALLVAAAVLFTVAGLTGYYVDDLALIVASRFVVGLTSALVSTLTVTIVAQSGDEASRHRWMGIMVGVGTFLAMVLIPVAGILGDVLWRDAFLLQWLGLPIAILAWIGRLPAAPSEAAGGAAGARATVRFDLIAIGLCAGIAINVPSIYAPFKLSAIGVHSAALIGLASVPLTLMAAIVSPFFGRLRTVASAATVFVIGYAGLALGLAAFLLAPTLLVALCGYGIFGAALGIVISNVYAVGSQSDDAEHGGSALGQALAAYYAAPLGGQLLLEFLVDGKPLRALTCLAAFSALTCLAWLVLGLRSPGRVAARPA